MFDSQAITRAIERGMRKYNDSPDVWANRPFFFETWEEIEAMSVNDIFEFIWADEDDASSKCKMVELACLFDEPILLKEIEDLDVIMEKFITVGLPIFYGAVACLPILLSAYKNVDDSLLKEDFDEVWESIYPPTANQLTAFLMLHFVGGITLDDLLLHAVTFSYTSLYNQLISLGASWNYLDITTVYFRDAEDLETALDAGLRGALIEANNPLYWNHVLNETSYLYGPK